MPLLNKKPLEPHRYNKKLEENAEVFYCKYTNEIFEDYEEYCERIILCNSLIWTCAITGKTNLTYQEALTSEQNALKAIKDFPPELRNPVLFLASKANRRDLEQLLSDVFNFVKDRYFLGESVEALFDQMWVYAHVLEVILPTEEEIEKYKKANKITVPICSRPYPPELYKYRVEQLDDVNDCSEIRILSGDKIRRIKGVYTKEKNRVYLKQFAEYKAYRWRIQKNILSKYSISSISFSNMFAGEPPIFDDSPSNELRFSQPSIEAFLTKSGEKNKTKNDIFRRKSAKNLQSLQKEYQSTINSVVEDSVKVLEKQARDLEELRKKKERETEERVKLDNFYKEWQRKRDDLECEDLKPFPPGHPVDCRVPNEHFGDVVMILEFFTAFGSVLNLKSYFPAGLKFELVERALMEYEIAGPFTGMLEVLLTCLFTLQEREDDEIQSTNNSFTNDMNIGENGDLSVEEAIRLSTIAATWSKTHYGVPLNKLSLDAITVSEILRLHILSSGSRCGDKSAKWRYQERGGYTSADDPCIMLRLHDPHIPKFLATKSVAELPLADKVKVLHCLMSQIITYAELRDIIYERYDNIRASKLELKNDQIAETKRVKEIHSQRVKERKEAKKAGKVIKESAEQKEKELEETKKKNAEFEKRAAELQKAALQFQIFPIGRDRAYRKYWIFSTVGGLFVEDHEEFPGSCLAQPTPIPKNTENSEDDVMTYVRNLFKEERNNGSDKENEEKFSHPLKSPKKNLLSESNDLSNTPSSITLPQVKEEEGEEKVPDLVCTSNPETCPVHTHNKRRPRWIFFHKESELEDLIKCLNKRGYREHRLRKALVDLKSNIKSRLDQCPIKMLNKSLEESHNYTVSTRSTRSQNLYPNANLKYPPGTPIQLIMELYIREIILDTEEKLFKRNLGLIKVYDRNAWRNAIECRSYDKQDSTLTWKPYSKSQERTPEKGNEEDASRPDTPCSSTCEQDAIKKEKTSEKLNEDDTSRPDTPCSMEISTEHDILPDKIDDQNQVVKDLASAVLQVERGVRLTNFIVLKEKSKSKSRKNDILKWESSLMSSTSLAQIYLHIGSLENKIEWRSTALNARCKACTKGTDWQNMLLCDSCDSGYHMYCLQPKLNSIPRGNWFCDSCLKPQDRRSKKGKNDTADKKAAVSSDDDSEDNLPLSNGRVLRSVKSEEVSKKRTRTRASEANGSDSDGDNDSSDEPLSKIARTTRRSAQKRE